jgi:nicotinamidase-related amidase
VQRCCRVRAAGRIRRLLERCRARGIAVIYVNDQLGAWDSDVRALLARCAASNSRGMDVVQLVLPRGGDHFLFKPKHSAFFSTALDVLLEQIGARTLILTGVSTHQCILFTATDAHVREFALVIPRDCVAAPRAAEDRFALEYFESVLGSDTRPSSRLRLEH